MFRNYSSIIRILFNPNIFGTTGIFRNRSICRTLVHSEPCQTSNMERFAKIVNSYSCFGNISFSLSLLFLISLFFSPKVLARQPGAMNFDDTHAIFKNSAKQQDISKNISPCHFLLIGI